MLAYIFFLVFFPTVPERTGSIIITVCPFEGCPDGD